MLRVLVIAVALVAGCGGNGGEVQTTEIGADPVEVVSRWLVAVSDGDTVALETLVAPVGLAVVAAVENNLRSEELAGLIVSGVTGELAADYWEAFRNDFAAIRGEDLSDVSVVAATPVPGVADHAAVVISTPSTEGNVVLIRTELGWQVDFVATVGPALVGPLGAYLESALSGQYAAEIADAYAKSVVPGLEAALALDPLNSTLEFETEYIRQLSSD